MLEGIKIDSRWLGIGRILVAIIVLGDLVNRMRWVTCHYTDEGILPRAMMFDNFFFQTWFTFNAISG